MKIEIEEVIQRLKSEAEEHQYNLQGYSMLMKSQIAEWLEELKDYRDKNKLCIRIDVENLGSLKDKCFEIAKEYYNNAIDDFCEAMDNELFSTEWVKTIYHSIAEQLKGGGK